jgi:hypothetical protein
VSALANHRDPQVLEGPYPALNQRGVEASRA